jgi:glycosyltransferase involved in cell wall biosynthesis
MFASLIIPTRDKAAFLALTLASLERQTGAAFEVVVVDDGSSDDTREVARGFDGRLELRYVRRAHRGRAAARNAAIRASRGEVLICCDDDLLASPGFVAAHVEAQRGGGCVALGEQRAVLTRWSREADLPRQVIDALIARRPALADVLAAPAAELVSPDDVRDRLDETIAAFGAPDPWWSTQVAPFVDAYGPALDGFAFPWTLAATGNLSTTRALADRAGLFDEGFVGWGLEDNDFHLRLHRLGAPTRVVRAALNHHQLHARGPAHVAEWWQNARRMLDKYDSLEVCLYLRVVQRRLTMAEANRIALERIAAGAAVDALAAEMIRICKDSLTQAAPA